MKTIVLASALVAGILVGTTSGRPLINKRALVTEVVYVTETIGNVAVYVDENGAPYSTTTEALVASTPSVVFSTTSVMVQSTSESAAASQVASPSSEPVAPPATSPALPSSTLDVPVPKPSSVEVKKAPTSAASASPLSSSSEAAPTPTPPPPAPTTTEPAPPPAPTSTAPSSTAPAPPPAPTSTAPTSTAPAPTSAAPAPAPPASSPDVPANKDQALGMGVTYDPFTGSGSGSGCKSDDQVAQDFDRMKDYKAVRIYAGDCGIVPLAVKHAIKNGQKLMAGAYLTHKSGGDDLSNVIQNLKSAIDTYANHNWDVIALFSVENERVNDKDMTASDVVDAINRARKQLRGLGYNGPVGAVETVPAMTDNPSICDASDVVMVNCHAFFDSNTVSSNAGKFVKSQVDRVKQTNGCKGKRVVVTESGWPHQGNTNGRAVASENDQKAALDSIRADFDSDMFLFNAFDSPWKSDSASTFNAEPYWGIIR